jgi:hypothetical protein
MNEGDETAVIKLHLPSRECRRPQGTNGILGQYHKNQDEKYKMVYDCPTKVQQTKGKQDATIPSV